MPKQRTIAKDEIKIIPDYAISSSVSLPINQSPNPFIPKDLPFEGNKKLLEQMAIAVQLRQPVLLMGDTGTGKTSAVRHLAAKTRNGFRRINLNGQTGTDELEGKILLNREGTYWVDGVMADAMRNGYWLLMDEINAAAPEVLFVLHSLMDDDGYIVLAQGDKGEVLRPHPDFRLFATMNPSVEYAGTKEMNKAFISRFFVLRTDYLPEKIEAEVLVKRTGIKRKVAMEMVGAAKAIRDMKAKEKIDFTLSTRELIQWATLFRVFNKFLPAAEPAIINKLAESELSAIKDLLGMKFRKHDGLTKAKADVKPDTPIAVGDKVRLVSGRNYTQTGVGSYGQVSEIRGGDAIVLWDALVDVKTGAMTNLPVPKSLGVNLVDLEHFDY